MLVRTEKIPQQVCRWEPGPPHQPFPCTDPLLLWLLGDVTTTFSTLPGLLICLQSLCCLNAGAVIFTVSLCNCPQLRLAGLCRVTPAIGER